MRNGTILSLIGLAVLTLAGGPALAQEPQKESPPPPGALRPFIIPRAQEFRLANGMRVVVVERHTLPVVTAQLLVDAGAVYEPQEKSGLAVLAAGLLSQGTRTLTATELAERMEALGAQFWTSAGLNGAWVAVTALTDAFPEALALAGSAVSEPAFREADFERRKTQAIAGYAQSQANVQSQAATIFNRAIFEPSAPHSRRPAGTQASLSGLTRDDVVAWHRAMYAPANSTLLLVGDVTVPEARRLAEQAFGKWSARGVPRPEVKSPVRAQAGTRVILVDRPGSVQSGVYLGHAGIGRNDPDFLRMTALNHVLGGGAIARLNKNLREKHGWTYGAFSVLNAMKATGTHYVTTSVRTNATDSALVEAVREYRRIAQEPVPADELKGALSNLVTSFPNSVQSVQELAGRMETVLTYDLPLDYYGSYRERLAALTPQEVAEAARKHLRPDALTVVVVGDLAQIEAPVRALNLGAVEVWSLEGEKLR
ncbi:MAG TPA: pitrilysin family protein [Longimicrobiaceae bacterium]|nr:pitrilysin family protein [Longimicrobiaceae bacterium]